VGDRDRARSAGNGPQLGRQVDFKQSLHAATQRDYIARVADRFRSGGGTVPNTFGEEYWKYVFQHVGYRGDYGFIIYT
jgi:hypothetical protein